MDSTTNDILNEILEVQKQQSLFLQKHLLRIKYSLWTLLILMTLVCLVLGTFVYPFNYYFAPSTPPTAFPQPMQPPFAPTEPTNPFEQTPANPPTENDPFTK
jgi:hypothetical protein